jgi:hypothetical protein
MTDFNTIVPDTTNTLVTYGEHPDERTILHKMFDWQRKFGDHCFEKNGITDNQGQTLTFTKIFEEFEAGKFKPNDLTIEWCRKFSECMAKELGEFEELLPWKHWSSASIGEEIHPELDLPTRVGMAKIELVDIWHFLMSAMMCLGMGPKELYDLYIAKNKVNFERQNKGYNTAFKTEEDNLQITKEMS